MRRPYQVPIIALLILMGPIGCANTGGNVSNNCQKDTTCNISIGDKSIDAVTPPPQPDDSSAPVVVPTPAPTQLASSSPSPANYPAGVTPVALADLQPSRHAEDIDVQEVKFGGTDYGPTWIKSCIQTADGGPQYDTWDVSGYSKLTLTLGVPSDLPPSGVGAAARFTFADASGKELTPAFTLSATHPKTLTVPLAGVDDLTIGCIDEPGPKETSGGAVISFGLGNATLR